MAVIYLTHELHGQKVATCEDEAVNDEKNGWNRYDIAQTPVVAVESQDAPKRRGRPPRVMKDGDGAATD